MACSDFFKSEHTHAVTPPFPKKVLLAAAVFVQAPSQYLYSAPTLLGILALPVGPWALFVNTPQNDILRTRFS